MKKRSLLMGILSVILALILLACDATSQSSDSGNEGAQKEEANSDTKNDVFFKTPRPAATEDKDTERLLNDLHGVYTFEAEGIDLFVVFDKENQMIKMLDLGMNQPGAKEGDFKKEDFKIEENLSLIEYSGFLLREREDEILVVPRSTTYQELKEIIDVRIMMRVKVLSSSVLSIDGKRYMKVK